MASMAWKLHAIEQIQLGRHVASMAWGARRLISHTGDWQERDRRKKLEKTIAKQREACANAVESRGDYDPEVDPELGIVAARAACVPTFLVGLSPDARYDPRVLDARKRKIEADWSLALMAQQTGPVSKEKARWLKAKANLRRVAADARDDEEAKRPE